MGIRYTQPQIFTQIDPEWIAKGLVTALDQNKINLIPGGLGLVDVGTIIKKPTTKGVGRSNSGAGYSTTSGNHRNIIAPSNTAFTVICMLALNTTGQTNKFISQCFNSGANQAAVIYGYVANNYEFFAPNFIGSDPRTGSSLSVSDTFPHTFCYAYDGVTWSGALDGKTIFSVSRTFNLNISPTSGTLYSSNAGGDLSDSNILLYLVFNRGLTRSDQESLSNNPWQIFKSQSRRIWVAGTGGTVWNVSISESVSLSEALSAIAGFQGNQAESLALTDSQSATNVAVVSTSESISLADAPSSGVATGASISESLALAESLSASALFAVSIAEAMALVEAVASALTAAVNVTEAMALSETPSATGSFVASVAESVALADSSSTSGQVTSADITESMALTDALTASALFATAVAESLSLADVLTAAAQFQAAITEAMALVDSSSTSGLVLSAAIVESMSLIDAWSATASLTASVIEALSLVDLPQAIAQMGVVQVEALALADSTTGNAVYTVAISELVTLADVVDWVAEIINTDKYPLKGVPIIRPLYGVSIQYPLA